MPNIVKQECHICQRPGNTIRGLCNDCRRATAQMARRGRYLRALREVLDLSEAAASDRMHYARMYVRRAEQGEYVGPEHYAAIEADYRRYAGQAWPRVEAAARAVLEARDACELVGVSA